VLLTRRASSRRYHVTGEPQRYTAVYRLPRGLCEPGGNVQCKKEFLFLGGVGEEAEEEELPTRGISCPQPVQDTWRGQPLVHVGAPPSQMSMRAGPGRTYRFYKGVPLWPFGHGRSYTSFTVQRAPVHGVSGHLQETCILEIACKEPASLMIAHYC